MRCVFSQDLSARGPEITLKQRYRLKKLLQICQTAKWGVLDCQREVFDSMQHTQDVLFDLVLE